MNRLGEFFELLIVLALVVACHVTRHNEQSMPPANTMPAMLKAIDLGVTTLDMDVVLPKDKQAIPSFDSSLNHSNTSVLQNSKPVIR